MPMVVSGRASIHTSTSSDIGGPGFKMGGQSPWGLVLHAELAGNQHWEADQGPSQMSTLKVRGQQGKSCIWLQEGETVVSLLSPMPQAPHGQIVYPDGSLVKGTLFQRSTAQFCITFPAYLKKETTQGQFCCYSALSEEH